MKLNNKTAGIRCLLFSWATLCMFFSVRDCWSGIQAVLGLGYIQYIILSLFIANFILSVCDVLFLNKAWAKIVSVVVSVFTIAVWASIFFQSTNYILIYLYNYSLLALGTVAFAVLLYLICRPKTPVTIKKPAAILASAVVALAIVLCAVCYATVSFTNKPVVYAVEDNYQIIFTTTTASAGGVHVGGKYYHDSDAGSDHISTVHKVSVPMSELDAAKQYTTSATRIFWKGPYTVYKGGTITYANPFKPVDESDGLNYQVLADVHDFKKGALGASRTFKDNMDFLILNGDIISIVEYRYQMEFIGSIARDITQGQIPVIFAKGNHESYGPAVDKLHRYIGVPGAEQAYYTTRLGSIYFIVLDLGVDHPDDWWEYGGTVSFYPYRKEQIKWLENIAENGNWSDARWTQRVVISHQAVGYANKMKDYYFLLAERTAMVALLNKMNISFELSGHYHEVVPILKFPSAEDDIVLLPEFSRLKNSIAKSVNANFKEFLVSSHALQQLAKMTNTWGRDRIGLAISYKDGVTTIRYVNSQNETITVKDPITGTSYAEVVF